MPIALPDDARRAALDALQAYFRDERDEDIGTLQAGFLLDFVLAEIAPSVYNQAVRDARDRLAATVADLDADLHVPEFASRSRPRARR